MVNWKKLFEEDYDELEEKSNSKTKKRKSLFEEEKVEDFDDEEEYYAALEAELNSSKTEKSKVSRLKNVNKFEEDELEDYYEEDEYQAALEEELREENKKSSSFFKKKKAQSEYEEDILAEDFEGDFDLEEKTEKKSRFSFFKKKEKETEEDIYDEEDILEEDFEEDFDLEEKTEKKSRFSFFGKKEETKVKEEASESEIFEEDEYGEYDEYNFTDVEEDLLEDEVYEELEKEEKPAFSFFKKKKDEDTEEVYEETEEYVFDDLDLDKTEEEKSKKTPFSFAGLKERFTNNDKDTEETKDEEDIYDDYEEFDDLELEKEDTKKESYLSKFKSLFKSKDKTEEEDSEEYYEEDEPEDYKTYLERQKSENQEKYDEFDLEEDYLEEDLDLEEEKPAKSSGKEFFASIKDKFRNKFKSSKEEEYDYDEEYDLEEEYDEELQEKETKKESFFNRFKKKSDKYEEDLEIEYVDEEPAVSEKLDFEEEIEVAPEEEDISLEESLRSFGIETDQIKSVDVFEERSPKEERERRVHPTLASVKVRRILQEKEIDSIAYDLSLSDGKDRFAKSIAKSTQEVEVEPVVKEVHESKHQEEIERLNQDFNRVTRKQDKISTSENFLRDRDGDKIEDVMNSIKSTQEEISRDTRDYTIELEESEGAPVRRSKLSYTSLDDVLLGNEDVLVTDIERKKYDVSESEEPHPEEIENFRKDLFKDKTSQDLVSNSERSNLDNLILETNIVEKSNEKELDEITMLEENLELIKEDKVKERASKRYEDSPLEEFEEEISIEKVAKESEYKFEPYEELRHSDKYEEDDLDYDQEEFYEVEPRNEIEHKSEQVDIEALNRELKQKKIDEYRSQYWGPKNNSEEEKKAVSSTSTTASYEYSMSKQFQAEKPRGIEYEEKLYTNDVDEYFVTEDAPLTFGEYKTQDRGYRPVSKTTIEEKQRKLDAIFDKYSNVKIPRKNTTEYVQQKISTPVRVDKYKPTQVVSAIYGTSRPAPAETTKVAKDVQAVETAVSKSKLTAKNNYFQEIASKEEQSWNLDLPPRPQKNKKSKKK